MRIKIKEDAGSIFLHNYYKHLGPNGHISGTVKEFADKITAIQGMTIEIETKYLWENQFNTAPIEGISEDGLRILNFKGETSLIEEIIDDARPSRRICNTCGHYQMEGDAPTAICWWCGN